MSVELDPTQASVMLDAYWSEQRRIRHQAEPWESQAYRDEWKRDQAIQSAINLGVPQDQVERFVFGKQEK